MFKIRLKELLELQLKGNQAQLAAKTQIPKTTINGWLTTEREPSSKQLILLADFFQVSTDYLLGRENDYGLVEIKGAELAPVETEIIILFRKLDERRQTLARAYIKALAGI